MIQAVFCIKAIKKDTPFDFWKHPKINNSDKSQNALIHFDNLDNSLINEIYQNECVLSSNCFLIRYRTDIYVITCRHSILGCFKYEIEIEKKKYQLSKIIDIPEFDTSILKINKDLNLDKYDIIDITDLDCKINDINKISICCHNKVVTTNFIKTIENDIGNEFFTVIPQICLEVKNKNNIFGLSGSPCFNSIKKFIGHVFSYDDNNTSINIIPAYCLKYIFTELIPKSIIKLKTVNIEGSICSIFDDITNKNLNAYRIKKNISIDYKIYDSEKSFNFRENMLITKINDLLINKEGCVFLNKMNIYITPQTYVLLNNNLDYIKIDGYELIDGNYSEFTVNIIPEILLNHMLFSEYGNSKVVIYKNMVFTELNREILHLVPVLNKNSKLREILDDPYTKKFNKQIILIDILENISLHNDKLKILKTNLEKNSLIFLNKINKKNINNLEDLLIEINKINENNFSFDTNNKKYRTLLY
jgi:hypothetical protein